MWETDTILTFNVYSNLHDEIYMLANDDENKI